MPLTILVMVTLSMVHVLAEFFSLIHYFWTKQTKSNQIRLVSAINSESVIFCSLRRRPVVCHALPGDESWSRNGPFFPSQLLIFIVNKIMGRDFAGKRRTNGKYGPRALKLCECKIEFLNLPTNRPWVPRKKAASSGHGTWGILSFGNAWACICLCFQGPKIMRDRAH